MMPFWIALQFLTTFPIQLKSMPTAQQNAQSLLFYPFVGLLIGAILVAVASILSPVPIILSTVSMMVVWIWLTGGLHLDGLADTADAWVGGFGDSERTLRIMKDPSCGPIGVLSLILVCMVKAAAVYVLLEQQHLTALLLIPVLGRLTPLFLFMTTPYVRQKGLGSSIHEFLAKPWAILMICIVLSFSAWFGWEGSVSAGIGVLVLLYLRLKFIQRIGGITGDTVGASIEIIEAITIFSLSLLLCYG